MSEKGGYGIREINYNHEYSTPPHPKVMGLIKVSRFSQVILHDHSWQMGLVMVGKSSAR